MVGRVTTRSVGGWERAWDRARSLGLAGTARAVLHLARRRGVRRWRKIRARVVGTGVGSADLARALGVSLSDLGTAVAGIRREMPARLPVGPDDAKAILAALERAAPDVIASTVSAADRICDHILDLMGSGPVSLGPRIDWHRDFKSGYRWDSRLFYTDVPLGHVPGVDIKVPWELSRGQHLPILAQAYLFAGRERYAPEAVDQIRDWIRANPPQLGVNWASAMDVAIRAVNWLWTAGLLADAQAAADDFFAEVLASLLAHGRHVAANLEIETNGLRTNHYLAEIVGLLYLGLCVPEFHEASPWRAFAVRALVQEMEHQVLPDGADYESSISYHRLVTELFLSAALLCRHRDVSLPSAFWERLARMVEFVRSYTKPNGLAPQVGDADDGHLHVLTGYGSTDPRDHRHLLALGALLFERDDLWAAAGPAWTEALWFGATRGGRWDRPSATRALVPESAAFPNAGIYVMRAGEDYVLFNASPVGTHGLGNHKHNDLLALEVRLGGEDILIDPGSYLYTSDPEARNAFRGTAAHATVMVDGAEQNRFVDGNLFCLRPDANLRVLAWEPGTAHDRVSAEHDGYCRLADAVVHRRTVTFDRATGRVDIADEFVDPRGGRGLHELAWAFPFAPGCTVEWVSDGWMIHGAWQRARLTAPVRDPGGERLEITSDPADGGVSSRYGVRKSTVVLRWRWKGFVPLTVRFTLERV